MIISYTYPYELTQTPMFADTEKDFEKYLVNSSGYVESNKFLVSLWNQVNTHICPKHCVDRAPWAYFPGKYVGKKLRYLFWDFARRASANYTLLWNTIKKEILTLC